MRLLNIASASAVSLALCGCAHSIGGCTLYSLSHSSGEQHRYLVPSEWVADGFMKGRSGPVDRFYISIPYEQFKPVGVPLDQWARDSSVLLMVDAPPNKLGESVLIGDPNRFETIIDPKLPGLKERRSLDYSGGISQRIFQSEGASAGFLFINCPSSSLEVTSYCTLYGTSNSSIGYEVFIPVTQLRYFRQYVLQTNRVLNYLEISARSTEGDKRSCPAPSLANLAQRDSL